MRYRTFVLLSTGGMLLGTILISFVLVWMDSTVNVAYGISGGVSATVLVLVLDLMVW